MEGLIVRLLGGFYDVETSDGLFRCRARGKFRKEDQSPVVGDRVKITPLKDGTGTVDAVLPRKNKLRRPPLANLDQLFLVVSMKDPVPNLLIIDKMLAICTYQKIDPILILTKTDLLDSDELEGIYRKSGYPVYCTSPEKTDSLEELRALLQNKLSAFSGNSGVGKSTLLNRLLPELQLETGETSQKLGRGRHTTRHVELFPVQGGYVADTPGFSSMDLMQYTIIRKEELENCFIEFTPFLGNCRFTGCSHTKEKGCAVLDAMERGEIIRSRHESYCAMYEDAKQIKEWELK